MASTSRQRQSSGPRRAPSKPGNRSVPDAEPRLVGRVGPLEIDIPRSLGYFGGIALAVTAGLIDPPLGLFIAAIPLIKMADLPKLPNLPRFAAQIFEGVAKPVGGDSEGTVRLVSRKGSSDSPVSSG
jgi:hypothetical protein